MDLEGKLFNGEGKAEDFLSLKPYKEFLTEFLGFKPFPGTMNLRVDRQQVEKLKNKADSKRLGSFEYQGEEYGGLTVHQVNVEGVKAGLLEIDRSHYGEDVAEIVAEDKLRQELGIEAGDNVRVTGV